MDLETLGKALGGGAGVLDRLPLFTFLFWIYDSSMWDGSHANEQQTQLHDRVGRLFKLLVSILRYNYEETGICYSTAPWVSQLRIKTHS